MQLVFASSNSNKIIEINKIVPKPFSVIGMTDIGVVEEIKETGVTIKENSLLKARYVFDFLKKNNRSYAVFADDSGLEVDALNNAPGVYSARYAGVPKNDVANNLKLLNELKLITNRNANFVTIITLIINDTVCYFEGRIKGTISYNMRGESGFGYDPLFIPQGYRSTFAELGSDVKNSISHRALAFGKLIDYLSQV